MRYTKNITVANNGTTSEWVDYSDERAGNIKVFPNGIVVPATFTGTTLRFQIEIDGTAETVNTPQGTDNPITLREDFLPIEPWLARILRSYRWRILVSAQAAERNFKVVFNDL